MTRALMIQGTGSDVGKSLIVAGLARAFTRRGLRVRPFKPQNMSNNAAVTAALFDMFCGLNGRTLRPRRVNARPSPATINDLPTSDPVPWIISARPGVLRFKTRSPFAL